MARPGNLRNRTRDEPQMCPDSGLSGALCELFASGLEAVLAGALVQRLRFRLIAGNAFAFVIHVGEFGAADRFTAIARFAIKSESSRRIFWNAAAVIVKRDEIAASVRIEQGAGFG